MQEEYYNKCIINIFERYKDLKKTNKQEYDNKELSTIFEYYSCVKLSEEYKKTFYHYNNIKPDFKELNKMSRNDTGIDCCDLENTIVQCKLRKNTLCWKECSTFIGSQNIYCNELKRAIIKWPDLIITRNSDCILSKNLLDRCELFTDRPYIKHELIEFCENLIINPPEYPIFDNKFELRDYQLEAIDVINKNNKNVIINLPTGTGKNSVIIYSMKDKLKYLILVPRIILMYQLKEEIIKHKPKMKSKIQLIGDSNNNFDEKKLITICVFNSVNLIENYCSTFEKIFIDEAHHINKPAIYYENEEYDFDENFIDEDFNEESSISDYEDYYEESDDKEDTEESDDKEDSEESDDKEDSEESDDKEDMEESDDKEDELINVKKYTKIIKSLDKYENNIYLSATIDKCDNFEYYSKDIREMIDLKYLCDYQIHVPIFTDDPTNKNICEHLLKHYRSIIIYCNTQKEGKQINKLMNELRLNSSEYIDCNTSKKKRDMIIENYKNGETAFLINVRILVEGFDAPITNGVCFLHLPTSKTTLIQIIGRCLRLHPNKTIANVILPFSAKEDEKNISNFLKVMSKNDSRIKKSFENKKIGGYISIENINDNEEDECEKDDDEEEDINNDLEFKYNLIYDSIGILQNGEEIWMKRLDEVKLYIDENGKRPNSKDKDTKNKRLAQWLSHQKEIYKKNLQIMKKEKIYNKWSEFINHDNYKVYFLSNEELWNNILNQVIQYINKNNKRPSKRDNNSNIKKLGAWIGLQQVNYKKKLQIMKNKEIYNKWKEFINNEKYKIYFQSNEEIWNDNFIEVKKYIDINNKKPLESDKNLNIKKLGVWISYQQQNYKKKEHIMKNNEIYNKWTEFINDNNYKKYFLSNEEIWNDNFIEVKKYIDINNKKPSMKNKDIKIKQLGKWLSHQQQNYKKKEHIMKNNEIYNKWTEFINDNNY
jgi:superfamily II DNA or RNA helicase